MLKLIKLITFTALLCFAAHSPATEHKGHKLINQTYCNYLAFDLSTDILDTYSKGQKAPDTLQSLTDRLEDLTKYIAENEATDGLCTPKLLDSLRTIVDNLSQPQQAPQATPVNTAVDHVRDHLKTHKPPFIESSIAQPPTILDGIWTLTDTVSSGAYQGMSIGFKLRLSKGDITFEAKGEKYWENGAVLPEKRRTPIHIYGVMHNNVVRAAYFEGDPDNESSGEFVWLAQDNGNLSGVFVSSIGAEGQSHLVRSDAH